MTKINLYYIDNNDNNIMIHTDVPSVPFKIDDTIVLFQEKSYSDNYEEECMNNFKQWNKIKDIQYHCVKTIYDKDTEVNNINVEIYLY